MFVLLKGGKLHKIKIGLTFVTLCERRRHEFEFIIQTALRDGLFVGLEVRQEA